MFNPDPPQLFLGSSHWCLIRTPHNCEYVTDCCVFFLFSVDFPSDLQEFQELVDLMETYSKRPSPFVAERLDHALNDLCSALSSLPLGKSTLTAQDSPSNQNPSLSLIHNPDSSSHNAIESTNLHANLSSSFGSTPDNSIKANPDSDIPSQMDAILEQFDRTCSLLGS